MQELDIYEIVRKFRTSKDSFRVDPIIYCLDCHKEGDILVCIDYTFHKEDFPDNLNHLHNKLYVPITDYIDVSITQRTPKGLKEISDLEWIKQHGN